METKINMIHEYIDAHRDEIIAELAELTRIPSVADNNAEIKPFGKPCIDIMEYMLRKGSDLGFDTHNYENYVGRLALDGNASIDDTIGIWAHLDVVPVDDKWTVTAPFEPVIKEGCIFGRGVSDNKDSAVGGLFLLRALKELDIKLNHNIALYMGTNEETGMHDLDYYLEKEYPLPKFSLVPDAGYPGMRGQFGRIEFDLISDKAVSPDIIEFNVGQATNIIPSEASITLSKSMGFDISKLPTEGYKLTETADTIKLTAVGTGGHAGWPHGKLNALYLITKAISENGCLDEYNQEIFDFITAVNADISGKALGIDGEDEYGDTVCSGTMAWLDEEGRLRVRHDTRYRVSGVYEEHKSAIAENAAKHGMKLEVISYMNGSARAADSKEIRIVADTLEEVTGNKYELDVSRGGTYAGKLPRALAVGLSFMDDPDFPDFVPEGHGWGHQPDELLPLDGYITGLKAFASILVRLDEAIK